MSIHGVKFPLTRGGGNDDLMATDPLLLVGATNDFRIHEVAVLGLP